MRGAFESSPIYPPVYQLGLSLEQGKGGFLKPEDASGSGKLFRDDIVDNRAKNVRPVRFLSFFFVSNFAEMDELIFSKENLWIF